MSDIFVRKTLKPKKTFFFFFMKNEKPALKLGQCPLRAKPSLLNFDFFDDFN